MPYVTRNEHGAIATLMRDSLSADTEFLAADSPEITSFLGTPGAGAFERLDADFVRVIEDVIDTLLVKNVINITDLPEQAQAKLFARKSFRERVTQHSLRLFGEAGATELIGDTQLGDLV